MRCVREENNLLYGLDKVKGGFQPIKGRVRNRGLLEILSRLHNLTRTVLLFSLTGSKTGCECCSITHMLGVMKNVRRFKTSFGG